ncbi:hypothetical protein Y032_0134g1836 [Ancylostoma ceylanicum]|uniref:Uncharacterized protein n=1 Tax=Ancylostoma ceylanicum TaxID=53326 RepID=A0A016T557_9BILA|nr:hypothetical protein Y032_0134g1836 [Ancylostoma ceylanicum]
MERSMTPTLLKLNDTNNIPMDPAKSLRISTIKDRLMVSAMYDQRSNWLLQLLIQLESMFRWNHRISPTMTYQHRNINRSYFVTTVNR